MELEKQVVSLELAQRLKELGVKQESYFYWIEHGNVHLIANEGKSIFYDKTWSKRVSAFTVSELGEMLPEIDKTPLCSYRVSSNMTGRHSEWAADLIGEEDTEHIQFANTEADARAKMLIYLLENKLI